MTGRRPDFVVIGATKCGTTSLHDWLSAHPDVWMAPKDLRFFTAEHNWRRGLEWYLGQFAEAPAEAVVGEMSNAYTRDPVYAGAAGRLAAHLPRARLVYLIRDPLKRLESHYRHRLVSGIEWRDPEAAFSADERYLAASQYGHQLACYRAHFPAEQILVLRAETLFADPGATLSRLALFLGLDPARGPPFARQNVTAERVVAPWPVRRLSVWPPARRPAKRLARAIGRSPVARFLVTADQPQFALSGTLRARIIAQLTEDRALLERLVDFRVADWSFGAEVAD